MKKITKGILLFFSLFFLISVHAKNVTYEATYDFDNIKEIITEPNFNIMLQEKENTNIIKTDINGNILITKELENITNANIIKWDDTYVIVGKQNNNLIIRNVDEYLRTLNTLETSIILPKCQIDLYKDKKNIYILFTNQHNLISRTIYQIDEHFNLKENTFSSIPNIKDIIKKDYPLLEDNIIIEEQEIYNYFSSTYKENTIILVGNLNNQALLTIKKEEDKKNKIEEDYNTFLFTTIVNDFILVLAKNDSHNALLLYDLDGNRLEEYLIEGLINEFSFIKKGQNKLYITTNEKIITYSYETTLVKEENKYGTLSLEGEITPYNKIKYKVIPNTGYEVKEIILKNDQGDILESKEEYFIMPNTNAYLSVVYEEKVTNPNTADPVLFWIIGTLLIFGISIKLYKKYKWLKN